ncbi:type II toxin-antitoxin system VapC family toxin [Frankia sp. Cas3]|uniref:type II toxin-antitoxin system VapC family toxin n=1 Tax=Frankia sp. Cas3 TaxID=3073926 RepID=UPI002AD4B7FE|nr:PIN domain-containing protein [Frankia sp. Cas3]
MIVVDTSALIELLADGRGWRAVVAALLAAEEAAGERLFAPALVDAEAAKVLKRLAGKELPEERATATIKELAAMDLVRCTFGHLLLRIWELRHNLYPFDLSPPIPDADRHQPNHCLRIDVFGAQRLGQRHG